MFVNLRMHLKCEKFVKCRAFYSSIQIQEWFVQSEKREKKRMQSLIYENEMVSRTTMLGLVAHDVLCVRGAFNISRRNLFRDSWSHCAKRRTTALSCLFAFFCLLFFSKLFICFLNSRINFLCSLKMKHLVNSFF